MAFADFISTITQTLSSGAEILTNPLEDKFKAVLERWSNISVHTPGAILRPANQLDTIKIVKAAHESSIPFVPASGGHSPWSTIDSSGFILDLGLCKSISIDPESQSAIITGSVLMKELSTALSEAGRCTATGNGNTVGVIPFCLGGGISTLSRMIGFGCDQILAAKIITADGTLIHASADVEPELLWAIKGAGQFFGVVVELTMKTYPLSIFGSPSGIHWVGSFLFPLDRAEEVCKAMESLMVTTKYNTSGLIMVMSPPPAFQPMLAVAPHFIGDPAEAPVAYQALINLNPIMLSTSTPHYPNLSDQMDHACAKGDFKRFSLSGFNEFKAQNFLKVIETYKELLAVCPDAGATGYAFEWHTGTSKLPSANSAFGNEHVHLWLNCFSWYHKAKNHDIVLAIEKQAIAAMRDGYAEEDWVDYANCNRTDLVQRRYRGAERLEKLMSLKKKWDPQGVFTRQLL